MAQKKTTKATSRPGGRLAKTSSAKAKTTAKTTAKTASQTKTQRVGKAPAKSVSQNKAKISKTSKNAAPAAKVKKPSRVSPARQTQAKTRATKPLKKQPVAKLEAKTAQSGQTGAKMSAALDNKTLLEAWAEMVRIRRFEERAGQLYAMGKIGGFCHLYIGQEAVAVGMQLCVKVGDQVITGYRDHAHMLACGMDAGRVMAELTGRRDGYSAGKGGSMHMFSAEKNFFGGHGIVAAQVPIGTGLALANQYRGNENISFVYFGDGAANQGQVYESFNMAELWRLPVIYIVENNRYAMGTSLQRASAQTDLSQRGVSFNIPGEQVDGMDIEAVYQAGQRAIQWVKAGKGPIILEMLTYRYRGHSMSDPAKYRKREEVDDVREHSDPIMLTEQKLIARKVLSEDEIKERRRVIYDDIADAVDFALESPLPDASSLLTDIYAGDDHAG